jgi:parallel beta-helix repeat protein
MIVIVIEIVPKVTAYTPHDPFRINNNTEFATMAGLEGWIGDGSSGFPYIIEGYDIDGSGYGYCIYIGNTTVHFEVRDSYLHEANGIGRDPYFRDSGITLYNVQNGTLVNNTVSSNNYYGIYINEASFNNTITYNNISSNNRNGIYVSYSDSNTITNNNVSSNSEYGVYLFFSDTTTISNNTMSSNNLYGIYVDMSHWNTISNNTASNNDRGISTTFSVHNTVFKNTLLDNYYGIYVGFSSNGNTISNNNVSNSYCGIYLQVANGNTIANNTASMIDSSGIYLGSSNGNKIINNTASNNEHGIYIHSSERNILFNNEMLKDGIYIIGSSLENWNTHNIATNNTVNGKPVYYWKNQNGGTIPLDAGQVILANCNNVVVENQNTSDCTAGITLGFSSGNTIANNTVSWNNNHGIYLSRSDDNTISNNTASNNNHGIILSSSDSNTIANNTLSSNNKSGIALSSSHSNTIANNTVTSNNISDESGIAISNSHSITITNNNASSNSFYGIYLDASQSATIAYNTVSSNNFCGIGLNSFSPYNIIFHNHFINNIIQANETLIMINQWDNGYPIGGNYWSDYQGNDSFKGPNQNIPGSDGIGDTPYIINSESQDNYPLMEPHPYRILENYTILKQGWNLISIPLIQENQSLMKVLEMIDGWYDAVQWYDPKNTWKHQKIGKSFGNDLLNLNETKGFWIYINQPGDTIFLYNGTQPTSNQNIQLHPGWNMVGYPSLTSYNRTAGLNNLTFDTHVDAIWTYNAATQKYKQLTETDYFEIGKGYYIHAKAECTWVVPL